MTKIDQADQLFRDLIRTNGFCEYCHSAKNLETAHLIPRKYLKSRCLLNNAACLCHNCHAYFTVNPQEFAIFIEHIFKGNEFELVRKIAYDTLKKVDWDDTIDFLQYVIDEGLSLNEARHEECERLLFLSE